MTVREHKRILALHPILLASVTRSRAEAAGGETATCGTFVDDLAAYTGSDLYCTHLGVKPCYLVGRLLGGGQHEVDK